jgi:hypothetical protein
MGIFDPESFTVYSRGGSPVSAKYLRDKDGNYILKKDGTPYVVPADFNLAEFIDRYAGLSSSSNATSVGRAVTYSIFVDAFRRGGV